MKQLEMPTSPFVDALSFEVASATAQEAWQTDESPFQSVYELEADQGIVETEVDARTVVMNELYDPEFNYAIFGVMNQVAAINEVQFEQQLGGYAVSPRARVERLYEHCAPLVREIDLFFEAVDREMAQQPENEVGETAIEQFIDHYQHQQPLSPEFEDFLGKLIKKAKNVVKKGVKKVWNKGKRYVKKKFKQGVRYVKNKAKALGRHLLRAALSRLKKYARKWLEKVLTKAIDRLPEKYRPIAEKAAEKLGIQLPEKDGFIDSSAEIAQLQHEFDYVAADLLLADDEAEQDYILTEAIAAIKAPSDSYNQLQQARQQFKNGLVALGEAEEPTQLVEQFIPAVLGAAKIGIRWYGRKRVVKFLARYIARLIRKFIPREYVTPLSRAIVDAGLRLIKLEASEEDVNEVALEAITATVEETVRRVASLPEHIIENEAMLEAFVLEAFEQSATVNLPPVLPETVYAERPELREAMLYNGVWAKLPNRRYKKYTHIFDTSITPHTAAKIKIWGSKSLGRALRRQRRKKRLANKIKARMHIFEATPGTWLSDIAKNETDIVGLGSSAREAWENILPLTEEAAGMLLGEPRLGRNVPARYLVDPLKIGVGQRFYFLELPGATGIATTIGRCCNTHLHFNFGENKLTSALFLSEAQAQQMAVALRQKMPLGATLIVLNRAINAGVESALGAGALHQTRLLHGGIDVANNSADALNWLPPHLLNQFKRRLIQWQLQHVSQYLQEQPSAFVAAVDDPAQGVTVKVEMQNPPGLAEIGRFLAGAPLSLTTLQVPDRLPRADVQLRIGYSHE